MQKILYIIILLTNFLLMKSQACTTSNKIASLIFYYYSEPSTRIRRITITASIISKYQTNYYFLSGNHTYRNTLRILSIQCIKKKYNIIVCDKFQSSYISLEHINDDNCFMKLEEKDENYRSIKEIIQNLSVNKLNNKNNLTCTIERIYDKLKDSDQNSLTDTNLFSIIFLSSCAMLTFGLCIGWSLLVYYRRFKQYRIKKQQQKELECCVRRILDKSPIIIFNSKNKDEHFIDDDSVCAICLESFIDNEKLRKLLCSHYFHTICIDPWLLTHPNCPLCNENILNDSIPSISAHIPSTNHEPNIPESESANTSVVVNNNLIIAT